MSTIRGFADIEKHKRGKTIVQKTAVLDTIDFTPKITLMSVPVVGERLNVIIDLFPRDVINVNMTIDVTLMCMGVTFDPNAQIPLKQIRRSRPT